MAKIKQALLEREENKTENKSSKDVIVTETKPPAVPAASIGGYVDNWDSVPETGGSLIVGPVA